MHPSFRASISRWEAAPERRRKIRCARIVTACKPGSQRKIGMNRPLLKSDCRFSSIPRCLPLSKLLERAESDFARRLRLANLVSSKLHAPSVLPRRGRHCLRSTNKVFTGRRSGRSAGRSGLRCCAARSAGIVFLLVVNGLLPDLRGARHAICPGGCRTSLRIGISIQRPSQTETRRNSHFRPRCRRSGRAACRRSGLRTWSRILFSR